MNATAIRNVIVVIVMALFCILIGSYAAEDKDVSILMLATVVGIILMIFFGKRAWAFLYILPPLFVYLPLGVLQKLPAGFLVASGVLLYWTLMWIMGYVRFKWRTLPALDALVLVIVLYYALSFYWHPVSINALGIEADYVGGKEYVWCLLAVIYYVTLSSIPCSYEALYGVLRKTVYVVIGVGIIGVFMGMSGLVSQGGMESVGEEMSNSRFSMFADLGLMVFLLVYGGKSVLGILTSPKSIVVLLLCFCAVLLSGWRERLVNMACVATALSYIKREIAYVVVLVLAAYGTLLYLSEEKVVEEHFPFGMQRSLAVVPGVHIKDEVRRETEGSSEWRKVMWRWALDPRTGYIRDYVWGDGFGQGVADLNRLGVSLMRGSTRIGDQEYFASAGTWHNGPIQAIHRTGIVGLALIVIVHLYVAFLIVRVCRAYKGTPMFLLAVFFLCPYFGTMMLYYVSAGTITRFFDSFIVVGMAKVLYCLGREEGFIVPVFSKGRYSPMLIAEQRRHELIQRGQQESIALRRRG